MISAKETERLLEQTGVGVGSFSGVQVIYGATQEEQADRAAGIPPEPCGVVRDNSPACAQLDSPACRTEMETDFSCHALRADPFMRVQEACHEKVESQPHCARMEKLQGGLPEWQKTIDKSVAMNSACDPPQRACEAAKSKLARFYQVIRADWARQQLDEQDNLMLNGQPTYPP
jgi:hypothetical protein